MSYKFSRDKRPQKGLITSVGRFWFESRVWHFPCLWGKRWVEEEHREFSFQAVERFKVMRSPLNFCGL